MLSTFLLAQLVFSDVRIPVGSKESAELINLPTPTAYTTPSSYDTFIPGAVGSIEFPATRTVAPRPSRKYWLAIPLLGAGILLWSNARGHNVADGAGDIQPPSSTVPEPNGLVLFAIGLAAGCVVFKLYRPKL